jgi:hypothetical protein
MVSHLQAENAHIVSTQINKIVFVWNIRNFSERRRHDLNARTHKVMTCSLSLSFSYWCETSPLSPYCLVHCEEQYFMYIPMSRFTHNNTTPILSQIIFIHNGQMGVRSLYYAPPRQCEHYVSHLWVTAVSCDGSHRCPGIKPQTMDPTCSRTNDNVRRSSALNRFINRTDSNCRSIP